MKYFEIEEVKSFRRLLIFIFFLIAVIVLAFADNKLHWVLFFVGCVALYWLNIARIWGDNHRDQNGNIQI